MVVFLSSSEAESSLASTTESGDYNIILSALSTLLHLTSSFAVQYNVALMLHNHLMTDNKMYSLMH